MKKTIILFSLLALSLFSKAQNTIGSFPVNASPLISDKLPIWQPTNTGWGLGGLNHTYGWRLDSVARWIRDNIIQLKQSTTSGGGNNSFFLLNPGFVELKSISTGTSSQGTFYTDGTYSAVTFNGTTNTSAGIYADDSQLKFLNFGVSLKWPHSDGTAGQAITTDGAGNLSFTTISGGSGISYTDTLNRVIDTKFARDSAIAAQAAILSTAMNDTNKWAGNGTDIWNKNSGNIGIGTTTPQAKLDASGTLYQHTTYAGLNNTNSLVDSDFFVGNYMYNSSDTAQGGMRDSIETLAGIGWATDGGIVGTAQFRATCFNKLSGEILDKFNVANDGSIKLFAKHNVIIQGGNEKNGLYPSGKVSIGTVNATSKVNIENANTSYGILGINEYDTAGYAMYVFHGNLTSAQIQTGNSVPITVNLPQSPSGYYWRITAFDCNMTYGTVPFTSTTLYISSTTTAGNSIGQYINGCIQDVASGSWTGQTSSSNSITDNDTISISTDSDSVTGDSTVNYYGKAELVKE